MSPAARTRAVAWTRSFSAMSRLAISVAVGLIAATVLWAGWRVDWRMSAWIATAAMFVGWTWATLGPMNAALTRQHARREDPTHGGTGIVVVVAALASLSSVIGVLFHHQDHALVLGTIAGIVLSWAAIHTMFATHYARVYYGDPIGGIDFHQSEPPVYTDFAYVAFTVGMSFAISDTDLSGSRMRRPALVHALLSYLFGTVIVALFINLIAGLSS
ncbi:DUF1345 domain-containing protein [Gordonia sp. X0973]|uniref:DUF1345 domain-containing protein n=1 Tax=Gordonia sp. X0973 TaxID=2742602 RepID=UPI002657464D|nr:DUF1345 domain-containing protein [Gordonia sp. X0973]